jgi:hypothetical protein
MDVAARTGVEASATRESPARRRVVVIGHLRIGPV